MGHIIVFEEGQEAEAEVGAVLIPKHLLISCPEFVPNLGHDKGSEF